MLDWIIRTIGGGTRTPGDTRSDQSFNKARQPSTPINKRKVRSEGDPNAGGFSYDPEAEVREQKRRKRRSGHVGKVIRTARKGQRVSTRSSTSPELPYQDPKVDPIVAHTKREIVTNTVKSLYDDLVPALQRSSGILCLAHDPDIYPSLEHPHLVDARQHLEDAVLEYGHAYEIGGFQLAGKDPSSVAEFAASSPVALSEGGQLLNPTPPQYGTTPASTPPTSLLGSTPTKAPGKTTPLKVGPGAMPLKSQIGPNKTALADLVGLLPSNLSQPRSNIEPMAGEESAPMTPDMQAWSVQPVQHAHAYLRGNNNNRTNAAKSIRKALPEPTHSYFDAEVHDAYWQIQAKMSAFTRRWFGFQMDESERADDALTAAFSTMLPETVKTIRAIGSGGPGGEAGWRALFLNSQPRRALIAGIIGNVLVEQVFQHACFGADGNLLQELSDKQMELAEEDGFVRNRAYATIIDKYLNPGHNAPPKSKPIPGKMRLPPNFHEHLELVEEAIFLHLAPLLILAQTSIAEPTLNYKKIKNVFETALDDADIVDFMREVRAIVGHAALLSLQMRLDPHTVYYFVPNYKEVNFIGEEMQAFNQKQILATHPRSPEMVWPEDMSTAEKRLKQTHLAVIQICIMNGITAYRPGGWETPQSTMWDPKYEYDVAHPPSKRPLQRGQYPAPTGKDMGTRGRILCHAWVYCRWGKERRFREGRPADDPKDHGEDWSGGFIDFDSCGGVTKLAKTTRQKNFQLEDSILNSVRATGGALSGTGTGRPRPDAAVVGPSNTGTGQPRASGKSVGQQTRSPALGPSGTTTRKSPHYTGPPNNPYVTGSPEDASTSSERRRAEAGVRSLGPAFGDEPPRFNGDKGKKAVR